MQKFQKLKKCFDCGHPYFEVYTPIKNDNDYENRFSKKKFYDHFHMKCPICRSTFLVQLEYWFGERKKEKYGMIRMGKVDLDKNLDEGKAWWSNKTLRKDYHPLALMRGSKIVRSIKFGLERVV